MDSSSSADDTGRARVTPLAASTVRGIARACAEASRLRAEAAAASTAAHDAAVELKAAREREKDRAWAIETGREAGTKEVLRRQRLQVAASPGGSTASAPAAAMQLQVGAVAAALKTGQKNQAAVAVKVEAAAAVVE